MSISGSNNPFACSPVVFANTNSIISLGTITRDGNEFTFSVGFVWKINGVTYQNTAPVVLTIAEASEGFTRIDNALLNNSNTIELQQGLESASIALKPVAPDTNIVLTSWNISGTTISDTEDPINGTSFVKKSFFAPFISTVTGADAIIPLDPNGYTEIRLTDASLTSIAGFDLSLITGVSTAEVPYNGKPYIIRNLTGNDITIKNELGAADFPFRLSGGADLVFPNGQAIYVLYDAAGFNEIFKSWSTGTTDISGKQDKIIVVSASGTASNDQKYHVVANATFTDPSPVEGKGYEVFVRNGVATIGGLDYPVGSYVFRTYHSGSWDSQLIGGSSSKKSQSLLFQVPTNGTTLNKTQMNFCQSRFNGQSIFGTLGLVSAAGITETSGVINLREFSDKATPEITPNYISQVKHIKFSYSRNVNESEANTNVVIRVMSESKYLNDMQLIAEYNLVSSTTLGTQENKVDIPVLTHLKLSAYSNIKWCVRTNNEIAQTFNFIRLNVDIEEV